MHCGRAALGLLLILIVVGTVFGVFYVLQPPKRDASWQTALTLQGSGNETSTTFPLQGDQIRLSWNFSDDFEVKVLPQGENSEQIFWEGTQLGSNLSGSASITAAEELVDGYYYAEVSTDSQNWTITVEQHTVSQQSPSYNVLYDYYGATGLFEPGIHVIVTDRDPQEIREQSLEGFWKTLRNSVSTEATTEQYVSLLVSRGDLRTGGYMLEIGQINLLETYPAVFDLQANFTDPGKGIMVTMAFTNPTALVLLGKLSPGEYQVRLHIDHYMQTVMNDEMVSYPINMTGELIWTAQFTVLD